MEEEKHIRIKVNKAIDTKTIILNLTPVYLGVFVVFVIIGLLIIIKNYSFNSLVLIGMILVILYLGLQYLDRIDFLEHYKKSKVPDEILNDLF